MLMGCAIQRIREEVVVKRKGVTNGDRRFDRTAANCMAVVLALGLFGCVSGGSKTAQKAAGPDFWDAIPPSSSTIMPEAIRDGYWHGQFMRVNREVSKADQCQVVFFGDSMTWRWTLAKAEGKAVWQDRFAKYKPINMGNSGDITPVMLYRVTHGNLDFAKGQEPAVAVLLCGTNNYVVKQSDGGKVKWDLGIDTSPSEVADGVRAVAQAFRRRLPATRVIMLGILPVKNDAKWIKCRETNRINAAYNYPDDEVVFLDLEDHFLNADGSLKSELFVDGTHLTTKGYAVLADALEPVIQRLIKAGPIALAP
jgi:lysophospholipase L1-like esterase